MSIVKKQLHLYLVSDASGETVTAVGEAAYKRFSTLETIEYLWPLVRSPEQVKELISAVKKNPGIVLHSMVDGYNRDYLIEQCKLNKIYQICAVEEVVSLISSYIKLSPDRNSPGKHNILDGDYFRRIDSVHFTLNHDDGQNIEDYNDADIIILGISRTSKSPIAFYLAHRGYKVANLPIVNHMYYDFLLQMKEPLIIGITVSSQRLLEVRRSRCFEYGTSNDGYNSEFFDNYLSLNSIRDELCYADSVFKMLGVEIIDATNQAIEESASKIINIFFKHKGSHKKA